jgi:hypothetical protein
VTGAILSLLAGLGLRAGEVASLGLDDLDWRALPSPSGPGAACSGLHVLVVHFLCGQPHSVVRANPLWKARLGAFRMVHTPKKLVSISVMCMFIAKAFSMHEDTVRLWCKFADLTAS